MSIAKENSKVTLRQAAHKVERDFLTMANKDLSEAMNRYQQLQQAAKLALDALYTAKCYTSALPEYHLSDLEVSEAIETLKKAGVK
jgi:hypothetical protein